MPPLLIVIKKTCLHEFPKSLYTILFFLQCPIIVTIQQASGTFAKPLPSSEVLLMSRMSAVRTLQKYPSELMQSMARPAISAWF